MKIALLYKNFFEIYSVESKTMRNMKATNIIIILALAVFLVSEFGICNIAKADDNDEHCVGCCTCVCCIATVQSNSILIDSNVILRIFYSQVSFPQSSFSKGLERPPRTSHH